MRYPALLPLALVLFSSALGAQADPPAPGTVVVRRASTHPMAYHLSLPAGWQPGATWPVVVAIEAAGMDFPGLATAFVTARGARPYVVVVPHTLTNGSRTYRSAETYSYSQADWARVDREGRWAFDEAGLSAVLADVHRYYGGETRAFLTGWEAGGHTVWGMTLRHPDWWRGVAAVSTNYQGRYLDAANSENRCDQPTRVSTHPDRTTLPLKVLFCDELPPEGTPQGPPERARQAWMAQTREAMAQAARHGFRVPPLEVQHAQGHGPMPDRVLAWFDSLDPRPSPGR